MPYEWTAPTADDPARLQLWPYRSLPRRGFVGFFAVTVALVALPLLSVLGSPVLWFILIFIVLALSGMWMALNRSYRDAEIIENLTLDRDHLTLTRHGPRGKRQDWQANPYWVQIRLHETGGPVPNYLTLKGDGREVELGAFLSEDERLTLKDDLQRRLNALR
ncbi:MAG: hypothetical protein CFE34_12380 [Rhodobacteraceae bacterium PARR1]|nr:MAG: hypothetical protein CFE34_12380 [Rhodobacteraceae bacterium PARR1]